MPLIQSNLENSLASFFEDPPETASLCAQEWANAMRDYTLPIIPASTTVAAAAEVLALTLTPLFETSLTPSITALGMETAWMIFATTVGTGMTPAFVSTPPVGVIGFLGLFDRPPPSTHREAAADFARSIHLWMLTGLGTNSASGAVVNWS